MLLSRAPQTPGAGPTEAAPPPGPLEGKSHHVHPKHFPIARLDFHVC